MPPSEPADPPRTQRDSQPSINPIDLDLVRKRHGTIDARTKYYSLTEDARRLLEAHTQRCASVVGLDVQRRRAAN